MVPRIAWVSKARSQNQDLDTRPYGGLKQYFSHVRNIALKSCDRRARSAGLNFPLQLRQPSVGTVILSSTLRPGLRSRTLLSRQLLSHGTRLLGGTRFRTRLRAGSRFLPWLRRGPCLHGTGMLRLRRTIHLFGTVLPHRASLLRGPLLGRWSLGNNGTILSGLIRSGLIRSGLIRSGLIRSGLIRSGLILGRPTLVDRTIGRRPVVIYTCRTVVQCRPALAIGLIDRAGAGRRMELLRTGCRSGAASVNGLLPGRLRRTSPGLHSQIESDSAVPGA